MEKLTQLSIEVPHRAAGNIILQKVIDFEVYKDTTQFKAVPLCREDERIVANLPPELLFEYQQGKAQSPRGPREGNLHVINSIVEELRTRQMLE